MKLNKYGVALESLTEETSEIVRQWRNAPEVNQFMDYQEQISVEQQKLWFAAIQNNNATYFLIRKANVPIGMIHVENIDLEKRSAFVGLFIGEVSHHGTGVALSASLTLLNYVFESLKLRQVLAKVKDDNAEAIEYNKSLGFVKHEKFNVDFSYWMLTDEGFSKKKDALLKYINFI